MVFHLLVDLGWVDFHLDVPPSCPSAQLLPNSHMPRQKVDHSKVNSIQVNKHMDHPVVTNANLSSGWVFGFGLRIATAFVVLPGNFLGEDGMPFLGLPRPPPILAGLFIFFSTGFLVLLEISQFLNLVDHLLKVYLTISTQNSFSFRYFFYRVICQVDY